jgi:hypothetical protein
MADNNTLESSPVSITVGADPKTGKVIIVFSRVVNRLELHAAEIPGLIDALYTRQMIAEGKAQELRVKEVKSDE